MVFLAQGGLRDALEKGVLFHRSLDLVFKKYGAYRWLMVPTRGTNSQPWKRC